MSTPPSKLPLLNSHHEKSKKHQHTPHDIASGFFFIPQAVVETGSDVLVGHSFIKLTSSMTIMKDKNLLGQDLSFEFFAHTKGKPSISNLDLKAAREKKRIFKFSFPIPRPSAISNHTLMVNTLDGDVIYPAELRRVRVADTHFGHSSPPQQREGNFRFERNLVATAHLFMKVFRSV